MLKNKANVLKEQCVACGCCVKVCPKKAITIIKGMYSQVDETLCVGCKMCVKACPADVINIVEREVV